MKTNEARAEAQAIMDRAATYRPGRWEGVNYAKALRLANATVNVSEWEAKKDAEYAARIASEMEEAAAEAAPLSPEGQAFAKMVAEYRAANPSA